MKRRVLFCLLLTLMMVAPANAAYWEDNGDLKLHCLQDNPACQVLQMVMIGSFDFFDPNDSLTGRILSAALPSLRTVNEEDFAHFVDSFDVEEDMVRRYYYIALGNCLWADILRSGHRATDEEAVLLSLLEQPDGEEARIARQQLCQNLDAAKIAAIAHTLSIPEGFVDYVAQNENWREE